MFLPLAAELQATESYQPFCIYAFLSAQKAVKLPPPAFFTDKLNHVGKLSKLSSGKRQAQARRSEVIVSLLIE